MFETIVFIKFIAFQRIFRCFSSLAQSEWKRKKKEKKTMTDWLSGKRTHEVINECVHLYVCSLRAVCWLPRLARAFSNWIAFIVSDYFMKKKKARKKNMSAICHQYECSDKRNVSHGARRQRRQRSSVARVLFATCFCCGDKIHWIYASRSRNATKNLLFASHQFQIWISNWIHLWDRLGVHRARRGHITRRIHRAQIASLCAEKLFDWPNNNVW